jgi:glycerophosphoryl diester phosphodiesterase
MSLFSLFCKALVRPIRALSLRSAPNFQPESFHRLRFAHRGGYAYGPENTLELIANNVRRRGVNAIEIDLQITRDGHLVLFHDERVSRILDTERDARVSELSLAELQAIPLRDQSMGLVYVAKFADFLDLMKATHSWSRSISKPVARMPNLRFTGSWWIYMPLPSPWGAPC